MSANPYFSIGGGPLHPPRVTAAPTCNTPVFRFQAVLDRCDFGDWDFKVKSGPAGALFLQIEFNAPCTTTGESESWKSRKWQLSEHMTDSEVVQTAFKAVLTAQEHEARERFTYRGRAVFGPHFNVDRLWELAGRDDALQVRKPPVESIKTNPEVQARLEALYGEKPEPEPEYSQWFPLTEAPPEPGIYQRRNNEHEEACWSKWDGECWYVRSRVRETAEVQQNPLEPRFMDLRGQWRGLAKDPHAVNGYARGVWHDWEPGGDSKCPVPKGTIGMVRLRCGEGMPGTSLAAMTWRRMESYWRANEIVAFKIDPLP